MTLGDSIAVDEALLVLKALFLVLLYLFIWRIVRSASKDVRLPQESFILRPGEGDAAMLAQQPLQTGRLVVLKSPAIPEGTTFELDASALTIGRGGQNDVPIEEDEFASARHARFEPRRDGVWVQDRGSTNGTYVNGAQLDRPRRLTEGDVVRVGETDLRYER
jgi:pSer/pThr/pTyr-binding forkhead associated (FHA) protein